MAPPSLLPDGTDLRNLAWEMLAETLPQIRERLDEVAQRMFAPVMEDMAGMRLEQLLSIMASFIPLEVLVTIYDVVAAAVPNATHRAVREEGAPGYVTTNMDQLLEDDGLKDVLHLHGDWRHPAEIRTTISQYLDGLEPTVERKFAALVEGKRVLVIGYSGRDRDVLRAFLRHPPSYLLWLVHTTDPDPRNYRLTDEIRQFHDALRGHGAEIVVKYMPTLDFLRYRRWPSRKVVPSAPAAVVHRQWTVPDRAKEAIRSVDEDLRVLAVTAVMLELGMNGEVVDLLRNHPVGPQFRVKARKQKARALRRLSKPVLAMLNLAVPPRNRVAILEWPRNINEFAAAVSQAGWRRTADRLDSALIRVASSRAHWAAIGLQARARRAERASVRGDLVSAAIDFEVFTESAERTLGIGAYVDALTWKADLLKMRGDYADALALLSDAYAELPFTNHSQRAFALWKRAEITLVGFGGGPEITEQLENALEYATRSGDRRTQFWVLVTLADAQHVIDPESAARYLGQAKTLVRTVGGYGKLYLLLVAAESARMAGDAAGCRRITWRVSWRAAVQNIPSAGLAAKLIRADLAARSPGSARRRRVAIGRLKRIEQAYRQIEMAGVAAWVEVSVAELQGTPLGAERVDLFSSKGWSREATRAGNPQVADIPAWHVVM